MPRTATLTLPVAVEVNLRQPSMVGGKKGFERILWASKNVLNESLAWLFIDHDAKQTLATGEFPV
jgi:ribonuclease P/MRP protein subunit RPP40